MPTYFCDRAGRWVVGLSAALSVSVYAASAFAEAPGTATAPVGSLQRTAAAIDDSIDVYRLALVELVPALGLVHEAGTQPGAQPTQAVPPVAHEALSRLAASVQRRISTDALAALPRAYHIEIVDALEALASATQLAQVRLPARALARALGQQATLAADVVDVFSRERPIVAEVLGPDSALDTINDALGQLGLAEANITTIRDRKGTPGEQLQAFLRLEIALGRALDLIAAAEESGVHLGFEMPRATVGLSTHLRQMQTRLGALEHMVQAMEHLPAAAGADLRAEVHPGTTPQAAGEVVLSWTPPEAGSHAPALLRLYTGHDAQSEERLRFGAGLCAGLSAPTAHAMAQAAAGASEPASTQAAAPTQMASGRSGAKLPWPNPEPAAAQYRLATVSAFGVEHLGPWVAPLHLPASLQAPTGVTAALSQTAYDSDLFYHDAGSVTVSWQVSASDVADSARGKAYAKAQSKPVVAHYAVFRLRGAHAEAVGQVPAGVTRFVDRPSLVQLAQGVRYAVFAVDASGASAQAPSACGQSVEVRADVAHALRLAAAGAASLAHPNGFERDYAQRLARPKALPSARADFASLQPAEQLQRWQAFWAQTPMLERVRWHETWVMRMGAAQRTQLFERMPKPLAKRDYAMVHAGLWAAHNPSYGGEPARFFALLTAEAQRLAIHAWRNAMGPDVARAFDAALAGPDAALKQAWQAPVMQGVWFDSRDPEEQTRLVQSLTALDANTRASLEAEYVASLPEALRQGLVWPAWESLTPEERDGFLNTAPDILQPERIPDGLWADFLAWVAYAQLDEEAKVAAITQDAGVFAHTTSRLRYAVRPLDARLGFKLWLYAGLTALGFINGVMLRLVSRQLGPKP